MKLFTRFIAAVTAVSLLTVLLSSCTKPPADTEAFKALAQSCDYEVYDITVQYQNAPQIKRVTVAAPSGREFQIEFYEVTDRESAKVLYKAQSDVIENFRSARSVTSTKVSNGSNYARRTVTADGQYLMVSYIDNTVLYVPPTDKENKKAIEEFLDKFKY